MKLMPSVLERRKQLVQSTQPADQNQKKRRVLLHAVEDASHSHANILNLSRTWRQSEDTWIPLCPPSVLFEIELHRLLIFCRGVLRIEILCLEKAQADEVHLVCDRGRQLIP